MCFVITELYGRTGNLVQINRVYAKLIDYRFRQIINIILPFFCIGAYDESFWCRAIKLFVRIAKFIFAQKRHIIINIVNIIADNSGVNIRHYQIITVVRQISDLLGNRRFGRQIMRKLTIKNIIVPAIPMHAYRTTKFRFKISDGFIFFFYIRVSNMIIADIKPNTDIFCGFRDRFIILKFSARCPFCFRSRKLPIYFTAANPITLINAQHSRVRGKVIAAGNTCILRKVLYVKFFPWVANKILWPTLRVVRCYVNRSVVRIG